MITLKIGVLILIGISSFILGEFAGIFVIALCSANRNNENEYHNPNICNNNGKGEDEHVE